MLDEKALRRPGFSEGYPVVLADGQAWTFPRPRLRLRPKIVDGQVEVAGGRTFGPEFDSKLDVLFGSSDEESDGWARLGVEFEVLTRLLMANYALADSDVGDLLVMEPGDPDSDERWRQLEELVLGAAPKPSPAT
jgi:hypothetical protein